MKLDIKKANVFELAYNHKSALLKEDYELCSMIQKEVDSRIKNNTLDHDLMQATRYFNPKTQKYEGEPKLEQYNGLFDKYKFPHLI